MRNVSPGFTVAARWVVWLALWCAGLLPGLAADPASPATAAAYDYAAPKRLTGTLYAIGSERKTVLFTFRRTATRSNSVVHVERQFFATNGALAAEEKAVYESNRLVSCQMQEFQEQVSGAVQIKPDPGNGVRQKLFIGFGRGFNPPKGDAQKLPPDTLIDDTLYPFLLAHWDDLMRGGAVKFRFVSLEWERTFEFRLVKAGESVQNNRSVVQIRMEPTGLFVAKLVNPLLFTVEKDNPHRLISYLGRTTPRIKKGRSWKYLDAETVFDSKSERSEPGRKPGGKASKAHPIFKPQRSASRFQTRDRGPRDT